VRDTNDHVNSSFVDRFRLVRRVGKVPKLVDGR